MKGLDAEEAYVLEAAAGAGTPGESINTSVLDRVVRRGFMAYDSQPMSVSNGYAHYGINMTPMGWMMLSLYRQGIR